MTPGPATSADVVAQPQSPPCGGPRSSHGPPARGVPRSPRGSATDPRRLAPHGSSASRRSGLKRPGCSASGGASPCSFCSFAAESTARGLPVSCSSGAAVLASARGLLLGAFLGCRSVTPRGWLFSGRGFGLAARRALSVLCSEPSVGRCISHGLRAGFLALIRGTSRDAVARVVWAGRGVKVGRVVPGFPLLKGAHAAASPRLLARARDPAAISLQLRGCCYW